MPIPRRRPARIAPSRGFRLRSGVFSGGWHEPAPPVAKTARRRPAGSRRAYRRGQVRLDVPGPGADDAGDRGGRHRRSGPGPCPRRLPRRRLDGGARRGHALHRRRDGDDGCRRCRGDRGGDRPRRRRHRPRAARDPRGQAYRHGERRGRRACRPAAGTGCGAGGCGLQLGVRRPAGADLRAGGLGARLRLRRHCRGEGDEVPPRLPCVHAGDGMGVLRPNAGSGARGRDEPADVQLLPRRHQVRHRDGGRRQQHRPHAAARRARPPPPSAPTTSRACCGREITRTPCIMQGRSR